MWYGISFTLLFLSFFAQAAEGMLNIFSFNKFGDQGELGGAVPGVWYIKGDVYENSALGVALQGTKILVGGFTGSGSGDRATLVRLNDDGTRDTSFGVEGVLDLDLPGPGIINGIAVDSLGRIILALNATIDGVERFAVMRLTSLGSVDTGFNAGGSLPYGGETPGMWYIDGGTPPADFQGDSSCLALMIQDDNSIVAAGYVRVNNTVPAYSKLIALRLNDEGVLDTTFNAGGIVPGMWYTNDSSNQTYFVTESQASGICLQDDEKIVLACTFSNSFGNKAGLMRLTSAGILDASFNISGSVPFGGDVPGFFVLLNIDDVHTDFLNGQGNSVQQDNDHNLVFAGWTYYNERVCGFCGRVTEDGVLDTTFNPHAHGAYGGDFPGLWILTGQSAFQSSQFQSLVIDDQQRIIFSASLIPALFLGVFRLTADGELDTHFNPLPGSGNPYGGSLAGIWYFPTANGDTFRRGATFVGNLMLDSKGNIICACSPSELRNSLRFGCVSLFNVVPASECRDIQIPFNTIRSGVVYDSIIDKDDKIVVCGNYDNIFTLIRYQRFAQRDLSFGTEETGVVQNNSFNPANAYAVKQDGNGNYYVTGFMTTSTTVATLAVYDNNGLPLTDFGTDGLVHVSSSLGSSSSYDFGFTSDGQIIVSGQLTTQGEELPALFSYSLGGEVIRRFGTKGAQTYDELGTGTLYAITISQNGGVQAAGQTDDKATLLGVYGDNGLNRYVLSGL